MAPTLNTKYIGWKDISKSVKTQFSGYRLPTSVEINKTVIFKGFHLFSGVLVYLYDRPNCIKDNQLGYEWLNSVFFNMVF